MERGPQKIHIVSGELRSRKGLLTDKTPSPSVGAMKCPYCGHSEDRVLDTRVQKEGEVIRRRRECLACRARFTTVESLVVTYPMVIKKDGRREPFVKEKIFKGLQAAAQKRPISTANLEAIVEKIATWALSNSDKEIPTQLIGRRVMTELKKLDDVAYVRFSSVYKTFKDVQEFVETLEDEILFENRDDDSQLSLELFAQRPQIEEKSKAEGQLSLPR